MVCRFRRDLCKISKGPQEEAGKTRPSSILTCVIGFPAGSYKGLASTSIFEVASPGKSAPDNCDIPFAGASFLTEGSLVGASLVGFLWGMLRISLYRG